MNCVGKGWFARLDIKFGFDLAGFGFRIACLSLINANDVFTLAFGTVLDEYQHYSISSSPNLTTRLGKTQQLSLDIYVMAFMFG